MMNKKSEFKKALKFSLTSGLIFLIVASFVFLIQINWHFLGKKSVHEDAYKYETKACLAFYPKSEKGRNEAKNMCKDATKNSIYDYALIPYGDYYLVQYNNGVSYYVDKDYQEIKIENINSDGKKIISDYLRYSMKKDELDIAYTYDFLIDTYYENIDLNDCLFDIDGKDLIVHFNPYDYDLRIPLKYMQEPCNINLGYENELYIKPRYVSNKRKMICFTFDDGPDLSLKTSGQIVDKLYAFDSSATFFVLGNRLGEKQINYCKEAIEKGMEYGSHSQSHASLTSLSLNDAYKEIMTPYHDLFDGEYGFGYMMKVFRPPYGNHNSNIDNLTHLTAILWNVDSLDWKYRTIYNHDECVSIIYDKVIKEADENDIVLFHDIYQTSADSACALIEYFIKEGYQIVNASELMEALNIENVNYFSGR